MKETETGRVVIVTGGGTGMGRAIAERFAQNGDHVYVIGRRSQPLEAVAKQYPEKIKPLQGDITDPTSVQDMVATISETHAVIDVLVNCAGGPGHVEPGAPVDKALETWNKVIASNLTGTFLMIHAFQPMLKRPGGRVVNITSLAAFSGSSRPGGEAYAAAKAGVHGMTRTLVRQLAPQGITVNCVAPGFIEGTEFFGPVIPEERIKGAIAATPAGRTGQPEDVAPAVFYLASAEAAFVNGDIINVNGGQQFSR